MLLYKLESVQIHTHTHANCLTIPIPRSAMTWPGVEAMTWPGNEASQAVLQHTLIVCVFRTFLGIMPGACSLMVSRAALQKKTNYRPVIKDIPPCSKITKDDHLFTDILSFNISSVTGQNSPSVGARSLHHCLHRCCIQFNQQYVIRHSIIPFEVISKLRSSRSDL